MPDTTNSLVSKSNKDGTVEQFRASDVVALSSHPTTSNVTETGDMPSVINISHFERKFE